MLPLRTVFGGCLLAVTISAQRQDGQFFPCDPTKNATGACDPDPGLPTSTYSVDFTQETAIPDNWTISNYATINFGPLGAEFTYAKRYDAPQLWTDFFVLFGKISVEARIANGTGMISSAVLVSNDFDEIDFEFSGNNFGDVASTGKGQNNYFGKGVTGNYDRGSWFNVVDPQGTFHTYTIDWTPEKLVWEVDGLVVRTLLASSSTTKQGSAYQYPQTPSKIQLGIWAGGDPGQNGGTKAWAGGTTNISAAPYTMYVKDVKIESYKPAWAYNWTDQSGTWQSIDLLQQPVANVGNSTIAPPSMEMNPTDPSSHGISSGGASTSTLPSTTSSRSFSSSSSVMKPSTSSTTSNIVRSSSSSTPKSTSASSSLKPTSTSSLASSSTKSLATRLSSGPVTEPSTSITSPKPTSTPLGTTTKPKTTTTTKCTTTSTPKPTKTTTTKCTTASTPKATTNIKPHQWQWGGWGSWWRSDETDGDDGNWNWQRHHKGW